MKYFDMNLAPVVRLLIMKRHLEEMAGHYENHEDHLGVRLKYRLVCTFVDQLLEDIDDGR